jgi:hypothetical protein
MLARNVTLSERWHDVGGGRGFALLEADDASAIARWNLAWTDLVLFEVIRLLMTTTSDK